MSLLGINRNGATRFIAYNPNQTAESNSVETKNGGYQVEPNIFTSGTNTDNGPVLATARFGAIHIQRRNFTGGLH